MAEWSKEKVLQISEGAKRRYFKNLIAQVHDLRLAMESSDFEGIRSICHRVRGSAGLFGLPDLSDACQWMERAAGERKLEEIVEGFQVIEVIVSRNAGPREV